METVSYKELLSIVAIVLTFLATAPYIYSVLKGATKPHVFSWVIWGTTTFVVFLAQLKNQGGVGAWPIGVSGILTIFIAILAFAKRGDVTIAKTDWVFLITALSSLPLWYFTSDPLWAVVILTTVDVLGFGPTIRKAYHQPTSEPLNFYALFAIRNLLVVMALEHHSLTTVLFPAVLGLTCVFIMILMMYRRLAIIVVSQGEQ
ncbi:hypothetical protein [Methylotuvimicrobium alcaliphilum]|uniref:Uncharacterized protein n=1 Tax=Methylotuvimicrobium alcaliphilum (strain DSM 19304 / NCIMB 14124 / VKM B-2133 / 20Z) TaxID=1091494 RepID=G4ST83_META2|nr:hypothetical protein [Methylotuvimicrobium alcaliphilum]CCE23836.1 conserved membrane protein of unknown function [Methylotuvimicrobium alcaliphilum 20Z]